MVDNNSSEKVLITMIQANLVLCALAFIVGITTEKRKINPISLMFGEWFAIILLASMNLYDILPASDHTYLMIFIGLLSFLVGYYIVRIVKIKKGNKQYTIRNWLVALLAIISIIVFTLDAAQALRIIIGGGGLKAVREIAQSGSLYNNRLLNMLRFIVATPFAFAVAIVAPVNFFLSKKRNKPIYAVAIALIVLKIISDGSRSIFILSAVTAILCFTYTKREEIHRVFFIFSKRMWIGIGITLVTAVVLVYMTISRSGDDSLRYTYYYFAMEPIMFEKWTSEVSASNTVGYGTASFNGLLFVLFNLSSSIFGIAQPAGWTMTYDFIERVGTDWQVITSNGLTANSYVTVMFPFYLDGREYGICIGMIFLGVIMGVAYRSIENNVNERNMSIYSLMMIALLYSFQLFIFENIFYSMSFIMLLMIYKRSQVR